MDDQEYACKQAKKQQQQRQDAANKSSDVTPISCRVDESRSNRGVENVLQSLQGQIRTVKGAIEAKLTNTSQHKSRCAVCRFKTPGTHLDTRKEPHTEKLEDTAFKHPLLSL